MSVYERERLCPTDSLFLDNRTHVRQFLATFLPSLRPKEELNLITGSIVTPDFVAYLDGLVANEIVDLNNGLHARSVYPASELLPSKAVDQYYDPVREAGEAIRSVPAIPTSLKIIDRKIALVGVGDHGGAAIIHDPILVENYYRLFETVWSAARDEPVRRQPLRPFDAAILDLLANGATDDQIARSLHASERTIRRHVAAMMDLVSARSRFQLGQRAEAVRAPRTELPQKGPCAKGEF